MPAGAGFYEDEEEPEAGLFLSPYLLSLFPGAPVGMPSS
jgi:hypothetical protein